MDPPKPIDPAVVAHPHRSGLRGFLRRFGPGLITGAADDDPSGIATYSQVGAQFGYAMGWTVILSLPFMAGVQEISARIGRVSGHGLGAALRLLMPNWLVAAIVGLLVIANVVNIGADIGGMAGAVQLLVGGPQWPYALGFAAFCVACEIWLAYSRYVTVLKWMTLSLLAYPALLLVVHVPWNEVLLGALLPRMTLDSAAVTAVVAVLGTTISPYLLFWQAAEEAEDQLGEPDPSPLRDRPQDAPAELRRIRLDTYLGMAFSNLVALAVIVAAGATLHSAGITTIASAADAAAALKPIAGDFAAAVFAAGIVGTGLLAVPILAGSAAYAVGEALHWTVGLSRLALEARAFYAVIAAATLIGAGIVFLPIDPMRALFWSAVLNGAICGPMIAAMVVLGSSPHIMGSLTLPWGLRLVGWATAAVMVACTVAMLVL